MPKWLNVKVIILIVVVIVIVVSGYVYYKHSTIYPSTEDAYVNANTVHVAAQVSGKVATVDVQNYQSVKKGQLLFTIDSKPFEYKIQEAEANLALAKAKASALAEEIKVAEAKVTQSQADLYVAAENKVRIQKLVKADQASTQAGYQVEGKYRSAKAQVAASKESMLEAKRNLVVGTHQVQVNEALLNESKLNLSYTKVYAPANGHIIQFFLRPGSLVSQSADLFVLVEAKTWWVDANYKETQLARMKVGQNASISIDMYPGVKFTGKIVALSKGSGSSFSLLPPENATGNWVKVIQRYPVRIQILQNAANSGYPLRVGASADVSVDTR